jgi:hypothetical protein
MHDQTKWTLLQVVDYYCCAKDWNDFATIHEKVVHCQIDRRKKERKKEWIGLDWIDEELIDAAKENNLPEVERLLSVGADLNAKDHFSRTPLHWASCRGHLQVFINFREHGADIEAKGNGGWSPWRAIWPFQRVTEPNDSNGATLRRKTMTVTLLCTRPASWIVCPL